MAMVLDPVTIAGLILAGFAGAAINGVVGAGTLITFPTLLAAGAPPVIANGTNTLGLSIGSWSSAFAYRDELRGRRRVVIPALIGSAVGAAFGALLVIMLPDEVFSAAVPWLILAAVVLVALQPVVAGYVRRRAVHVSGGSDTDDSQRQRPRTLTLAIGASGVYGGYFGAGQGVVLMAVLGWLYDSSPQHANAAKNLFAATANITAALVFVVTGRVWWWAAALLAIGALAGGTVGARGARRLRPGALRAAVIAIGVIAAIVAWWRW